MRIALLGGTRFIGRSILEHLAPDHDVLVVHRGQTEPDDLPPVPHLHADRMSLAEPDVAAELRRFDPDVVIDCAAIGARDADAVLDAFGTGIRLVVLSSMDTYRAYGALHAGTTTDAVPLDESSPVRADRYPYRGQIPGMDDYEKLDVEERWLARGGVVARLPMVTGPHDYQRRQEFVLRRIRHGRTQLPVGAANALLTHGDVRDVAAGVALAAMAPDASVSGEVFNFGEPRTPPVRLRIEQIAQAAEATLELVTVPDDALPPDLGLTAAIGQHLLVSSAKAGAVLDWTPADQIDRLADTVAWHLANPPEQDADDFTADDDALAAALR